MPTASQSAPEAQDLLPEASDKAERFQIACKLLRNSGAIDAPMPGQRRGESQIDWLVRIGIAVDKYSAAEALLVAKGRSRVLDQTVQLHKGDAGENNGSG